MKVEYLGERTTSLVLCHGGVTIKDPVLDEPLRVFPGHRGGGGVIIKDPALDESRILRGAYHFACSLSWGG